MKRISLKKSKHTLFATLHLFHRKRKKLSLEVTQELKECLTALNEAIGKKDQEKASELSHEAARLSKIHLRKGKFESLRDKVIGFALALAVAVVIRQSWFELYEIPTGSMRPNFEEKDLLLVSKSNYGINIPLKRGHFYFSPELIKRGSAVVLTTDGMPVRDNDTLYFYLFPGKKQLIKRMIGKPGDTLYFYGGLIYGIDRDGNDISSEFMKDGLEKIDHIPFLTFEGNVIVPETPHGGIYSPVLFQQMNEPIARLYTFGDKRVAGEIFRHTQTHNPMGQFPDSYGKLWGMENFAMARLLTREEVKTTTRFPPDNLENAPLYLELSHNPSLQKLKVNVDTFGRVRPQLRLNKSFIPLQEEHLRKIFENLYTVRFVVKNGHASKYNQGAKPPSSSLLPRLPSIPDGTYEFYHGKAYEVLWQGILKELPDTHPLYRFTPENVQFFFNLGLDFHLAFKPRMSNQAYIPLRYAYFRDHDLYLMGAPIFTSDDPVLRQYVHEEEEKKVASSVQDPYLPFIDHGSPNLSDGTLDIDKVRKYGLMIPEKSYLVLGDNYAVSSDSRDFGFVPEANLRGAPSLIFWPPGKRWGIPNQPPYPWFTVPTLIVWALTAIGFALWHFLYQRRKFQKLLTFNWIEASK